MKINTGFSGLGKLFWDPPPGFAWGLRRYLGGQKSQTKNSDGMHPAGGGGGYGPPERVFGGL